MKINDFKRLIKETLDEFRTGNSKQVLNESSLSRLFRHIEENDCAIISASRVNPEDTTLCIDSPDDVLKGANNKVRSRDLKANLLAAGFGVTAVDGSYVENFNTPEAYEVKEDSFFCANLKSDPNFVETVISLGKKYCQDSVLIIPKGGEGAYLYGTNNAEFPGDDHTIPLGKVRYGEEDEFMTKIRNRPMTIKEVSLETYEDLSKNQRMAVKAISKVFLQENWTQGEDGWEILDDPRAEVTNVRDYSDGEYGEETGEYFNNERARSIAPNAFKDEDDMIQKMKSASLKYLSSEEMQNINNSDVGEILDASKNGGKEGMIELAKIKAEEYGKDWDRLEKGIASNSPVPAPMVLKDKRGNLYLLAGNTRLMSFTAYGKKLPVKIIDYNGVFKEERRLK